MKFEQLLHIFYEATRIPICHFSDNNLLLKKGPALQDFNLPLLLLEAVPKSLPPVWYSFTPEHLYMGGVRILNTRQFLFLGPILLTECTQKQADNLCHQIGRVQTNTSIIKAYFAEIGPRSISTLLANLKLLCKLLDQPLPEEITLIPFQWQLPYPVMETYSLSYDFTDLYEMEKTLLSCIQSGNLDALNKILSENRIFQTSSMTLNMNHIRSHILGANTLFSRAALSAGLDSTLVYELTGQYSDQILRAASAGELSEIFYHLIYDYTTRVNELRSLPSVSPIVQSVHQYISSHYDQKITPHILAKHLHLSCSYLCTHFKQETGMTISTYVQQEKISEAKRLLRGSSYSIVNISEALAFSSQSYFCAIFKKVTAQTPQSFRKETT